MLFPEHFLAVRATVDPQREEEFNRWYNSEHIPDVVNTFPGCLGASRFKVTDGDGSHQYMALYAFRSAGELDQAFSSPEIKELIRRYDQAIGSFSTRIRTTYTRVFELEKKKS
jgi:antibiotic biosynthesis monooxygenase (ABM) superfamily enzyme